jgi:hypothetical protein
MENGVYIMDEQSPSGGFIEDKEPIKNKASAGSGKNKLSIININWKHVIIVLFGCIVLCVWLSKSDVITLNVFVNF